ncbi:hypothetical protein BC831DRAFT_481340 [Entophlyctis helioformis]|nr:hypothetical protein BC831DRAFT_481340 [Entophlyctis helioformis]
MHLDRSMQPQSIGATRHVHTLGTARAENKSRLRNRPGVGRAVLCPEPANKRLFLRDSAPAPLVCPPSQQDCESRNMPGNSGPRLSIAVGPQQYHQQHQRQPLTPHTAAASTATPTNSGSNIYRTDALTSRHVTHEPSPDITIVSVAGMPTVTTVTGTVHMDVTRPMRVATVSVDLVCEELITPDGIDHEALEDESMPSVRLRLLQERAVVFGSAEAGGHASPGGACVCCGQCDACACGDRARTERLERRDSGYYGDDQVVLADTRHSTRDSRASAEDVTITLPRTTDHGDREQTGSETGGSETPRAAETATAGACLSCRRDRFPPGCHSFPFTLHLITEMPPSLSSPGVTVVWYLETRVKWRDYSPIHHPPHCLADHGSSPPQPLHDGCSDVLLSSDTHIYPHSLATAAATATDTAKNASQDTYQEATAMIPVTVGRRDTTPCLAPWIESTAATCDNEFTVSVGAPSSIQCNDTSLRCAVSLSSAMVDIAAITAVSCCLHEAHIYNLDMDVEDVYAKFRAETDQRDVLAFIPSPPVALCEPVVRRPPPLSSRFDSRSLGFDLRLPGSLRPSIIGPHIHVVHYIGVIVEYAVTTADDALDRRPFWRPAWLDHLPWFGESKRVRHLSTQVPVQILPQ